jgi:hypothetical protein
MTTFHAHMTIVNNSSDILTLDTSASSGINTHGENDWPTQINAQTTVGPFEQGFDGQIKFTAVYVNQQSGASQKPTVSLYMYGDGVQVFSTEITQSPSPPPYPGSYANATGSTSVTFTIA